eukprot:CAMPEP_0182513394 /NCGR_PEP_ID=MMETSP1321-20130603/33932_1 /TAXON_ID=91990 /ORGANISM="Bolidomonas sp., Strain RCC1657" /LENGTH=378 /DNA_ID=CAMNT_0024720403 /DNA_START=17 /DNA_END=1149 /DNA_ORIENTATION=+
MKRNPPRKSLPPPLAAPPKGKRKSTKSKPRASNLHEDETNIKTNVVTSDSKEEEKLRAPQHNPPAYNAYAPLVEGRLVQEEKREGDGEEKEAHSFSPVNWDEPFFITSIPTSSVGNLDDFKRFVTLPPSNQKAVYRCILRRSKSSLGGSSFSFRLEASSSGDSFEILARRTMMPSSFLISLDKGDLKQSDRIQRSKYYLGKVKIKNANEFILHDKGINPNRLLDLDDNGGSSSTHSESKQDMSHEEKEADDLLDSLIQPRIELGCVYYAVDERSSDRMMNVSIPRVFGDQSQTTAVWQGTTSQDKLLHNLKAVVNRSARNDLMGDQLMVCADYEDATRDVGALDYSSNRVLASEKNFSVEWMVGGNPGKSFKKSVAGG